MYINNEGVAEATCPSPVNHPAHYNQGGIECIDAIQSATSGLPACEAFFIGNALKYLWRYNYKGHPVEDLEKAVWYINRTITSRKENPNAQN